MDEEKEEWVHRDEYELTDEQRACWIAFIGKVRGKGRMWVSPTPNDETKDRMIRGQMEHELASIMFDVRNGRGYDDQTD